MLLFARPFTLSDWYGDRYVTVGYTFDRGAIDVTPGRPVELPPAADTWFEAPLGDVQHEQFMLDLGGYPPRSGSGCTPRCSRGASLRPVSPPL